MPFVKVKIEEVIEQKCQQSETFKKSWDESREEYRLIRKTSHTLVTLVMS